MNGHKHPAYLLIHNDIKAGIIPKNIWEEYTCGGHLHICQSKHVQVNEMDFRTF